MGFNVSVPLLPAGLESSVYSTPVPATTNVPETISALLLGSEPVYSAASSTFSIILSGVSVILATSMVNVTVEVSPSLSAMV